MKERDIFYPSLQKTAGLPVEEGKRARAGPFEDLTRKRIKHFKKK